MERERKREHVWERELAKDQEYKQENKEEKMIGNWREKERARVGERISKRSGIEAREQRGENDRELERERGLPEGGKETA